MYLTSFSASERVSGNPQVSLVSRAWDLRPRDVHEAEGAQGDVRGQDHEEQDDQLRAQVRHWHFMWAAVDINAIIIFSASTSQYHVRWTLMTIPWMLMRVSSKLEAVSSQNSWKSITSQYVTNDVSDYDTEEVVMCKAHFIYDVHRQRSLQHLIQIEELPSHFKTVRLPSGQKDKKSLRCQVCFTFFLREFSDFNPQKKTKLRTWTFREFLASVGLSAKMSTYHQN